MKGVKKTSSSPDEIQAWVMQSTTSIAALPSHWTSPEVRGLGIQTERGPIYPISSLVIQGTYPSSHFINVITKVNSKKKIKDFIEYLKSPDGQKKIADLNYIPLYRRN